MVKMLKTALILFRCTNKCFVRYSSQGLPQFSSEKYNLKRKNYATLQSEDVNFFKSVLSEERVLTEESDVLPYNIDWPKDCRGQSKIVLRPKSTQEVSQILSYCNERRLAVCPQGGNTSLVGASVPVFDEIILSMGLMNQIIDVDNISGALVCEAGCILEVLTEHVKQHGLIMPLDFGAKGTCQIGGNIATNAGGQRLIRYGNLNGSLLGIEAVKADGTVIDSLRTLKKDNTGYHLKHLFVGAEGTLGIITKVAIHCPVLPQSVTVAFFGIKDFETVLKLLISAKSALGEILSAFEVMDYDSIKMTTNNFNVSSPIKEYPFYVLLETHGSDANHDSEKLTCFLSKQMDKGLILDGTIASEPSKVQSIWKLRESMALAALLEGHMYTYDVSLPSTAYYQLIPVLRERIGSKAITVCGFGHLGDGNLHIIVTTPKFDTEVLSLLEPFIFEEVCRLRGSVSAEHGVGLRKPRYMHYSQPASARALMRDLKRLMDPHGILNPYKVLPDQ